MLLAVCLAWAVIPAFALAQAEPAAISGAFAVTVAEEDVPRDLPDRATVVGRWEIAFIDGDYALSRQDVGELARGTYGIDGDMIVLRDRAGVLACPAPGVYRWRLDADRLAFVAIEEPCARRRLILTTRVLVAAVPCPTVGAALTAALPASAPGPGEGTSPVGARAATPVVAEDVEAAIDDLLTRMSACWATRDPARFLPLTSDAYRAAVAEQGAAGYRRFALAMAAPIVWDRVEPVALADERHATAIVRQTSGDHQDLGRYAFVREAGEWRWDGVFGEP